MAEEQVKQEDGREGDRDELAVRDILNSVATLMERDRTFIETDLLLTVKAAAESLQKEIIDNNAKINA